LPPKKQTYVDFSGLLLFCHFWWA